MNWLPGGCRLPASISVARRTGRHQGPRATTHIRMRGAPPPQSPLSGTSCIHRDFNRCGGMIPVKKNCASVREHSTSSERIECSLAGAPTPQNKQHCGRMTRNHIKRVATPHEAPTCRPHSLSQGHRATGPQGHRAQNNHTTPRQHLRTITRAAVHNKPPPTLLSMRVVRRGGYDTRKTGWETTIWKGYCVPDGKVTYPQEPFLSRTRDHTAGRPTQAWVRLQDWWMARPRARNTADAHQPTCGTVRQQAGRTPRRAASLSYSSMIPHSSYRPQNHSSTTLTSTT